MTTKRPILPGSADIIAPAIAALVAKRPRAFNAINLGQGVYSHIFEGLRAQADLAIARLADGVVGNTPQLAKAAQLRAFLSSEFELPLDLGPTKAIGSCTFDRTTSTDPKLQGVIQKGKKLRREPLPDGTVPLVQADYEVASNTPIALNQNTVTVPIIAVREGSSANTPNVAGVSVPSLVLSDALFDKKLLPTTYDVGGGSDGFTDTDVLRYAHAFAFGQYGPTDDALVLSALRAGGVRRILVSGNTVYVADPSWASSTRWLSATKQSMISSDAIGYATRFNVSAIPNYPVSVDITVRLRDAAFLSDTTSIDTAIIDAIRSYFDDRDDFNVIGSSPIRSVVSRSDTKILRCIAATPRNLDGSAFFMNGVGHAYLANHAVNITYLPPV